MTKNRFKRLLVALFSLLALVLTAACTDSDDVGDDYRTFTGQTIKDFLDANVQYSNFETALDKAGALSLMSSYGKYTVFLPDNNAVDAWWKEKGYSSFEQFLDSTKAVQQMVFYHIIDGESNGVGTYLTSSFTNSNIVTKNMMGRFLYTAPTADGASWVVNNSARITSADNVMVNGVVHTVDHVVEGNQDLLSDYILASQRYQLYAEALHATGLLDSINRIEDESYNPNNIDVQEYSYYKIPKHRYYGYTALLESDSVLALNGIDSLSDMRAYAEGKYPGGKGKLDTDPNSSLYQFVAYHFLPYKLTSSQICPGSGDRYMMTVRRTWEDPTWQREMFRDGKYRLDNYLFPMAKNTLIYVQQFIWRDDAPQTPVFNDKRNPYDPQYTNFVQECPDAITIDMDHSNQDCLNGIIHDLTGMLYYREDVYHHRLRFDFNVFFPEMWNNDLIDRSIIFPKGYIHGISYEAKDGVHFNHDDQGSVHSYWMGETFTIWGRTNLNITIGPIPKGSYEVRIGYHIGLYDCGMVQYYLDGEPCGIPLDQSKNAKTPEIGWNQTTFFMQHYPGTSWVSGNEVYDESDIYGYNNDKSIRNQGFMKASDAYAGPEMAHSNYTPVNTATARNDAWSLRRILLMATYPTTTTHTLTISNLMDGKKVDIDYIEFMPKDLIEDEDTH